MGDIFRFKQFSVDQRGSTMKINTDGVLLGAMAAFEEPKRILDIGTGTGVIALMLAQRFPTAQVDAVEIDEQAAWGAKNNFSSSVFSDRLKSITGSFDCITDRSCYQLIVSNPPFYTNSLHNPDPRKKNARHTDLTFFQQLLHFAYDALEDGGQFQVILPTDLAKHIIPFSQTVGFNLHREVAIRSFKETEVIRKVLFFIKEEKTAVEREDFVIYEQKGIYSEGYKKILKPFFLAF